MAGDAVCRYCESGKGEKQKRRAVCGVLRSDRFITEPMTDLSPSRQYIWGLFTVISDISGA